MKPFSLRRPAWVFSVGALFLAGCVPNVLPSRGDVLGSALAPRSFPAVAPTPHPISLPALRSKTFDGRDFKLGKILVRNTSYTRYSITYRSDGLKISGIMNIPQGKGPFPLLVLNHGFIDPEVYTNGRGLKREQDYLARRGYVVLHPDYRNHADSDDDPEIELKFRLGYTEDVINAMVAVRSAGLAVVDAERVGMLGHSMGGGVTMNVLVTRPDLVQAAVLFAPVSVDVRRNFARWTVRRPEVADALVAAYGSPDDHPAFWANLSAINFLNAVDAPILIHHGTADADVPIAWSQELSVALREHGKTATFHAYPGGPHEFVKDWPVVMRRTVEFFDQHLKIQPVRKNPAP